jgi:hypothetical protein
MGRSLEPVRDDVFFSAAEDPTTETSYAGKESFSVGLLAAGCLRLPTDRNRQG